MKPLALARSLPDMDRTRFSELIRDHHRPLLAYARVLTGHPERAREIVQDAFVAAWQRINMPIVNKSIEIETTGFTVAISDKGGKKWVFIADSTISYMDLRSLFPTLPETMELPPIKRRIAEANKVETPSSGQRQSD